MSPERLELASLLQEAINLLVELESYMDEPADFTEYERIREEVMPRLAQLRSLMMN